MDTVTQPAPPPSIAHRVVNDEPVSVEEYLSFDREREERFEYIDGWIISMAAAATWPHSVIASNVDRVLGNQLLDTECRTASRDVKVALPSVDKHVFPDVVVVCGDPELAPDQEDLLLNPRLIVEVLSPSTMNYDRGEKFARYRQIDALQEYLLVAQDRPHVEHYVRQDEASWHFTETDGLDAEIDLPTLDATLPLSEIYLDVSVEPDGNQ
jgi:Uma2 family endonuclease